MQTSLAFLIQSSNDAVLRDCIYLLTSSANGGHLGQRLCHKRHKNNKNSFVDRSVPTESLSGKSAAIVVDVSVRVVDINTKTPGQCLTAHDLQRRASRIVEQHRR